MSVNVVNEESERECPVCYERFGRVVEVGLTCSHCVCSGCVDAIWERGRKCPVCRDEWTQEKRDQWQWNVLRVLAVRKQYQVLWQDGTTGWVNQEDMQANQLVTEFENNNTQ